MTEPERPPSVLRVLTRSHLLLLHVVAVAAVAAAYLLGQWQLGAWKEHRADTGNRLAHEAPRPLDSVIGPDAAFPKDDVGRPVELRGQWLPDRSVYVDGRLQDGRTGFWLVTPIAVCSAGGGLRRRLGRPRRRRLDAEGRGHDPAPRPGRRDRLAPAPRAGGRRRRRPSGRRAPAAPGRRPPRPGRPRPLQRLRHPRPPRRRPRRPRRGHPRLAAQGTGLDGAAQPALRHPVVDLRCLRRLHLVALVSRRGPRVPRPAQQPHRRPRVRLAPRPDPPAEPGEPADQQAGEPRLPSGA